jgi:hypothetical protein
MRALAFLIVIVLLSTTRIPLPRLYRHLWPPGIWPFCVRGHVRPEELMNSNNLEHAGTISIRRIRITDGSIEIVRDLKDPSSDRYVGQLSDPCTRRFPLVAAQYRNP